VSELKYIKLLKFMRDFRVLPRWKWDLCFSRKLYSSYW